MRDFMTSEPGIAFDHPDISEGNEIPGSQPGEPTAAGGGAGLPLAAIGAARRHIRPRPAASGRPEVPP